MISMLPVTGPKPLKIGMKHYFYVGMAALVLLTVFAGFAPSFFLRRSFHPDHELSVVLHIHGVVFSAWIILLLVQTSLIEKGSRVLHQRLGWVGVGIAVAMLLLVGAALTEQIRRGPPLEDAAAGIALNVFGIMMFAVPLSCAIYFRKRPDWHKRLMLGATFGLLGAPILRLILLTTSLDFLTATTIAFAALDSFFLPCFAYDLFTRGRIHRAYAYVLTLFIVIQCLIMNIPSWPPWLGFSRVVQHLLS